MARNNKTRVSDNEVNETIDEASVNVAPIEDNEVEKEVEVEATEVSKPVDVQVAKVNDKKVTRKIHIIEDVDCYIANVHYLFAKNREVAVSSDVASILVNSQFAYRV